MAKYKFTLRDKNAGKPTPLNLVIRWNYNKLVFPTGLTILPKYWNHKEQNSISGKGFAESPEFNANKDNKKSEVAGYYLLLKKDLKREPTKEELKEYLDKNIRDIKVQKDFTLIEFIEWYVSNSKTRFIDSKKSKRLSQNTVKKYETTKKLLIEFQKEKKFKLKWESINDRFYTAFLTYLMEDKNQVHNTRAKYIICLKSILNDATKRGYNSNLAYKDFKISEEETKEIYVNEDELIQLYKLDIPKEKNYLKNVRDWFIIGSYTGLRFSDLISLTKENIIDKDGIKFFSFKTTKTDKIQEVSIQLIVQKTLNRNGGELPHKISNAKFNQYVKELFEMIDSFHQYEYINKEDKGVSYGVKVPKYKLVKSHTMRRSYATNLYKKGVPLADIMTQLGHRNLSETLTYLRLEQSEANYAVNQIFNNDLRYANL